MKKYLSILSLIMLLGTVVYAKNITLTTEEANLVIQCISLAQIPNVAAAVEPLKLRDKIRTQAAPQLQKEGVTTLVFDLDDKDVQLLLTCIQSSQVQNVANAEAPINLVQKIVAEYKKPEVVSKKKKSKKKSKKKK